MPTVGIDRKLVKGHAAKAVKRQTELPNPTLDRFGFSIDLVGDAFY
jgi:hypothetical protein